MYAISPHGPVRFVVRGIHGGKSTQEGLCNHAAHPSQQWQCCCKPCASYYQIHRTRMHLDPECQSIQSNSMLRNRRAPSNAGGKRPTHHPAQTQTRPKITLDWFLEDSRSCLTGVLGVDIFQHAHRVQVLLWNIHKPQGHHMVSRPTRSRPWGKGVATVRQNPPYISSCACY